MNLLVSLKNSKDQIANCFRQVENWANNPANGILQPGDIIWTYGSATSRPGFLLANGATVNASQYPALAAQWGVKTGSFVLPNLINAFPRGATAAGSTGGSATAIHSHTLSSAGQAQIGAINAGANLAFNQLTTANYTISRIATLTVTSTSSTQAAGVGLAGSTDSTTISTVPPYVSLQPWIKY